MIMMMKMCMVDGGRLLIDISDHTHVWHTHTALSVVSLSYYRFLSRYLCSASVVIRLLSRFETLICVVRRQ